MTDIIKIQKEKEMRVNHLKHMITFFIKQIHCNFIMRTCIPHQCKINDVKLTKIVIFNGLSRGFKSVSIPNVRNWTGKRIKTINLTNNRMFGYTYL